MKCTATEEAMEQRRRERLKLLTFFMCDEREPENARRVMSLGACHCLLTGFFRNSPWRAAWFCFRKAAESSWMEFSVSCRLFWYRRVLRLSDEQIDERF